jgi:DNA-binding transcriptional regulator YdaS (Cro superfamily)
MPLRRIVDEAGSLKRLAEICGCSVANISQLLRRGSDLPPRFVIPVETALGLLRSEIRPDIYPAAE